MSLFKFQLYFLVNFFKSESPQRIVNFIKKVDEVFEPKEKEVYKRY